MTNREVIDCLRHMQTIDRPVTFEVDGRDNTRKLFAEYIGKDGWGVFTTKPQDYDAVITVRDILRLIFSCHPDDEATFGVASAGIDGAYTIKAVRQTSTDATIILEGGAA